MRVEPMFEGVELTGEARQRPSMSFGETNAAALARLLFLEVPTARLNNVCRHSEHVPDTQSIVEREPERFAVLRLTERE
jgi:hypothetical protein